MSEGYGLNSVRHELYDGKKFHLAMADRNYFKLRDGTLQAREVKCWHAGGRIYHENAEWQPLPFTGTVCWYVGAGWHTIGVFAGGVLQNELKWVDTHGQATE